MPLKCAGINLGVINMSNCSERLFTIDDLKLLHSLSMYAAMAIQNAKNFSSLRDAMDKVLMHATILDVW
ncbi:MAG: GAF domain-containing protein [Nitrospirae bacterium]|nr:GAF domain-containing protein [Nitrospirota bacterium]